MTSSKSPRSLRLSQQIFFSSFDWDERAKNIKHRLSRIKEQKKIKGNHNPRQAQSLSSSAPNNLTTLISPGPAMEDIYENIIRRRWPVASVVELQRHSPYQVAIGRWIKSRMTLELNRKRRKKQTYHQPSKMTSKAPSETSVASAWRDELFIQPLSVVPGAYRHGRLEQLGGNIRVNGETAITVTGHPNAGSKWRSAELFRMIPSCSGWIFSPSLISMFTPQQQNGAKPYSEALKIGSKSEISWAWRFQDEI